jgi:hypothetical protein
LTTKARAPQRRAGRFNRHFKMSFPILEERPLLMQLSIHPHHIFLSPQWSAETSVLIGLYVMMTKPFLPLPSDYYGWIRETIGLSQTACDAFYTRPAKQFLDEVSGDVLETVLAVAMAFPESENPLADLYFNLSKHINAWCSGHRLQPITVRQPDSDRLLSLYP